MESRMNRQKRGQTEICIKMTGTNEGRQKREEDKRIDWGRKDEKEEGWSD